MYPKNNFELRPPRGVEREEKNRIRRNKCFFDISSSNDFAFFREKAKSLNDEMSKKTFVFVEFDFFFAFNTPWGSQFKIFLQIELF